MSVQCVAHLPRTKLAASVGVQDAAGHVLAFEMLTGTAQVDMLDRFVMQLPGTQDFAEVDLSKDRQGELKGVEKEKPRR